MYVGVFALVFALLAGVGPGGVRNLVEDSHDQVMLALAGVIGVAVAALAWTIRNGRDVRTAAEQATAANRAVNNRTPGEHSLYDLVARIGEDVTILKHRQEQTDQRGWEALPEDLRDAPSVVNTIRKMQQSDDNLCRQIDQLNRKFDAILDELRRAGKIDP
jgi:hypothetical protein